MNLGGPAIGTSGVRISGTTAGIGGCGAGTTRAGIGAGAGTEVVTGGMLSDFGIA